jgi:hypothetical protein
VIADLAAAGDAPVVLVKGWEPPLLELLDWLALLREAIGKGTPILVLPLAEADGGGPALAAGGDARIWRSRLETTGDPWLEVVTGEAPA